MGYHRAGFEVVGVDIAPQPNYPCCFVQADALEFLRTSSLVFDAIHASPPCQAYSYAQRLRGNEHPDLIGPTRDLILARTVPYVIENVVGARAKLRDPIMLCGAMFPPLRVYRHRLFETGGGFRATAPPHPEHLAPQVKMGRRPADGEWVQAVGNFSGVSEARDAMGIPWATRNELSEAIPPAYTEHIGRQLLAHLNQRAG